MSQFNYFVVPTASFPSFYYINFPSATSLSLPHPETHTQIVTEVNLRQPSPSTSAL